MPAAQAEQLQIYKDHSQLSKRYNLRLPANPIQEPKKNSHVSFIYLHSLLNHYQQILQINPSSRKEDLYE